MRIDAVEAAADVPPLLSRVAPAPVAIARWSPRFRVFKIGVDTLSALLALPLIAGVSVVLLVLNPFFNPGPLFYRQERMGLGGKRFRMWKFRTMVPCDTMVRGAHDPVEDDRITPLGRILRRLRIDELPNFVNVLRGEMSLVGPRPDAWEHASRYIDTVPYYHDRFRVRPGITGLAQIRSGYADNWRAVERKARLDRHYVRRSRGRLELYIILATMTVVLTGAGAK